MLRDDVLSRLQALPASARREAYLDFVQDKGEEALWKGLGPEHLTASAFVFSPDADRTLMCFHRKGGFWVQMGGHLEHGDRSLAAAALREAGEESGLVDLELVGEGITDLDRHELSGGFTCAAHWDIGFTMIADPASALTVSEESRDVRWFPVDALPDGLAPGCARRVQSAREALT